VYTYNAVRGSPFRKVGCGQFVHIRQFQISRVKKTLKPRSPGGEIFIAFSSVIIFHRG
jgi:hypothetical protein